MNVCVCVCVNAPIEKKNLQSWLAVSKGIIEALHSFLHLLELSFLI